MDCAGWDGRDGPDLAPHVASVPPIVMGGPANRAGSPLPPEIGTIGTIETSNRDARPSWVGLARTTRIGPDVARAVAF